MAAGPVTDGLRAEAMERRVLRTARSLGLDEDDRLLLERAFAAGMAPRLEAGLHDHHPDYLHPSRTALILMDDSRITDPVVLAAALVAETRDPTFAADPSSLQRLGEAASSLVREVEAASGAGDRIMEGLLGLSREAALVALAERLDHARHLHLRAGSEWAEYHRVTRDAYAPLAGRTDPTLAGRIDWWCTTFQRRFLTS